MRNTKWYRDNKKIKLSDDSLTHNFIEFREYAGASDTDNIDEVIARVNKEDRVEFLPAQVRDIARKLREEV